MLLTVCVQLNKYSFAVSVSAVAVSVQKAQFKNRIVVSTILECAE